MSAIHFYRRYDADGRCRVICMQCFQALGTAWDRPSLEEMEAAHVCAFWMSGAPPAAVRQRVILRTESRMLGGVLQMQTWVLILLAVLALYMVPTGLEYAAGLALNPWLAVILPGDLIGCAVLAAVLRMPRTGIILYLLLTTAEGLGYSTNGAALPDLRWFADLVPTLLVVILMLRMKLRRNQPLAVS